MKIQCAQFGVHQIHRMVPAQQVFGKRGRQRPRGSPTLLFQSFQSLRKSARGNQHIDVVHLSNPGRHRAAHNESRTFQEKQWDSALVQIAQGWNQSQQRQQVPGRLAPQSLADLRVGLLSQIGKRQAPRRAASQGLTKVGQIGLRRPVEVPLGRQQPQPQV